MKHHYIVYVSMCFMLLFRAVAWAEDSIVMSVQLPFYDGDGHRCGQNSDDTPSHQYSNSPTRYDLDFPMSIGSIVVAGADGVFSHGNNSNGFGLYAKVDHENGYWTMYGHLNGIIVSDGQRVFAGQPIAYSGNSGYSTGPHIHYGVHSGPGTGTSQRMDVYAYDRTSEAMGFFATGRKSDGRRDFVCDTSATSSDGHVYESRPINQSFSNFSCRQLINNQGVLCWKDNPVDCMDGNSHVRYFRNSNGEYVSESNEGTWQWCLEDSGQSQSILSYLDGGYGVGGALSTASSSPVSGSKPDHTPDFDVFHQDGHEISANCDNCPTEDVVPGQLVTMRLETETNNRDVQTSDLFNPNSQSIDGEIWCRVEGITDWQEIPGSEDILEYDVGNLVTDNNSSVETISYTVPIYPGAILACQAFVDGDNEVDEESEGNNDSRVERFLIQSAPSGGGSSPSGRQLTPAEIKSIILPNILD